MLWWLLGAVVFVLLIACVNVANLLLAKSLSRQKELAVRTALGATRKTTFLQSLAESLVLVAAGGILGIGLGYSLLRGLLAELPRFTLPWATDTRLNIPVLFFTLAVTTLAGLLFGCVPAWYASRVDPNEALKSGGQAVLGLGRHRLQRMLVIGELAVALTLIAGAGLALHSFANLMRVDMGVKTDHVLTFYLGGPETQSKDPEKIAAYYRQILSSIRSVPGITSASAQTVMPLFPSRMAPFAIAGESASREDTSKWPSAGFGAITPQYFSTLGVRLMRGRIFKEQDTNSSVKVALVNEQFVHTYLNGADPLRQHILIQNSTDPAATATEWQIVGVYHNVLSGSMRDHRPEMLIPFWQNPSVSPSIAVRSAEDPELTSKSLAAAVHSVDTRATMREPRTMEQIRSQVLGSDRFSMILLVSFGTVALLLATLGVYGVMSFSVAHRTSEIALRMALGADRADLVAWVVSQGISLAVVGLSLGLAGAYFVGRGMQHSLFGVGQIDFTVLGIVALLLLFTVLIACLIPARRAASADPMRALRTE
jgi:putative ABC transport system permease protein